MKKNFLSMLLLWVCLVMGTIPAEAQQRSSSSDEETILSFRVNKGQDITIDAVKDVDMSQYATITGGTVVFHCGKANQQILSQNGYMIP